MIKEKYSINNDYIMVDDENNIIAPDDAVDGKEE